MLVSYLGQKNGFKFTTYLGNDVNTENTETDYHSGQVFHIDVTPAQHLTLGKGFIGIDTNAFYLKQTTGDSGSGARLGSFEEMIAGVAAGTLLCRTIWQNQFRSGTEMAISDQRAKDA